MNSKPQLLVVCGRNKKRSRTAESIFKNDDRFFIRSAGLSAQSNHKISEKDIEWSDVILVMEEGYKGHIKDKFGHMDLPSIVVLDIEDDYEYMDEELIEILGEKFNDILSQRYGL